MRFIAKLIEQNVCLYDKYAYFKLAYGRGANQLGIFKEIAAAIPELMILFGITQFDLTQNLMRRMPGWLWAVILASALLLEKIVTFVIGHIDIKNKLIERDVSLANQYNPELQKLLKR